MGGIISKPKAPSIPAPAKPAGPSPAELQAEKEAKRRAEEAEKAESLARSRRGLSSTVRTSYSGLLESGSLTPKRKTLLGE